MVDHADWFQGGGEEGIDVSRKAFALRENVGAYQEAFTAIEVLKIPIHTYIHTNKHI